MITTSPIAKVVGNVIVVWPAFATIYRVLTAAACEVPAILAVVTTPEPPTYATVPPAPNAALEPSVPVNVRVLLTVKVLPSAIVNVEPVAGAVRATLFIVVAVAMPSDGVVNAGDMLPAKAPVPDCPDSVVLTALFVAI
jgi:hypothetical protein